MCVCARAVMMVIATESVFLRNMITEENMGKIPEVNVKTIMLDPEHRRLWLAGATDPQIRIYDLNQLTKAPDTVKIMGSRESGRV